jgi:hypothetical protein
MRGGRDDGGFGDGNIDVRGTGPGRVEPVRRIRAVSTPEPSAAPNDGLIEKTDWWAPRRADWQVAALFAVGSALFALGSIPLYSNAVSGKADGITYFVGSLFFTSAALLQLLVATGAVRADERPRAGVQWRTMVRAPEKPEWWAGVVQFAGTIFFNISTFAALNTALDASQANNRVWTPDALGSIGFLVASGLAYAGVVRPWLRWRPRDLNWSVTTLNMVGSIAFGISALAGYIEPDTGSVRNLALDNLGTLIGAICFLFGAILLIPDSVPPVEVPAKD